jgi:plasmid stabilization system protein ParE
LKVGWTRLAVERAYEEARYIAEDKPEAALRWLDGLFKSTDRLEHFPKSGRVVREIGSEEYREIIYRSHRIIYRVERSAISILTVRGSAQLLDLSEIDPTGVG